jgi:catechol 2,3-dioxygenase-like lactoylglutathione lyase family enzyme
MKLGDYVEVRAAVEHPAEALATFEKLGLQPAGKFGVMTDGGLNFGLQQAGLRGPTLAYGGSDLAAIKAAGIPVQETTEPNLYDGQIVSPEGVHIYLKSQPGRAPMPEGDIMSRKPISRMGKFGEYAIPTKDFEGSVNFWKGLGFEEILVATEPTPWGIYSDGLIVIGLHTPEPSQMTFDEPHITYFKGDMADRIDALKADGFAITDIPPEQDGRIVNASMTGPGGLKIFLFAGEI